MVDNSPYTVVFYLYKFISLVRWNDFSLLLNPIKRRNDSTKEKLKFCKTYEKQSWTNDRYFTLSLGYVKAYSFYTNTLLTGTNNMRGSCLKKRVMETPQSLCLRTLTTSKAMPTVEINNKD